MYPSLTSQSKKHKDLQDNSPQAAQPALRPHELTSLQCPEYSSLYTGHGKHHLYFWLIPIETSHKKLKSDLEILEQKHLQCCLIHKFHAYSCSWVQAWMEGVLVQEHKGTNAESLQTPQQLLNNVLFSVKNHFLTDQHISGCVPCNPISSEVSSRQVEQYLFWSLKQLRVKAPLTCNSSTAARNDWPWQ